MKFKTSIGALAACLAAFAAPASAHNGMNRKENKLLRDINGMRASAGLPHLKASRRLAAAADSHSEDMGRAGFFAHTSSSGQDPASRISSFVHKREIGETLAWTPVGGNTTADHVFGMWIASPPHRAVLTDWNLRRIGIARRHGQLDGRRVIFWTADLASAR